MRTPVVLGIIGFAVMAAAIAYAFIVGDFFDEARTMIWLPWFHLSMIDLYAGFLLFASWVIYRERSLRIAMVWLVLILTLGNLTSFAYVIVAAIRGNGDWRRFWMGWRASEGGPPERDSLAHG